MDDPQDGPVRDLRVRLFGALAEHAGTAVIAVPLRLPVDVGQLRASVRRQLPGVAALVDRAQIAVDLEVVADDAVIRGTEEVAVLPPVAGGSRDARVLVGLRRGELDADEALRAVSDPSAGATVLFLGTVRDHSDGFAAVDRLEYRAYDEMATKVLNDIAGEVLARWTDVRGVALLHAVGDLPVGAPTIAVACSAPHRAEAFEACSAALEEVKARVPVWKREVSGDAARWVGADGC